MHSRIAFLSKMSVCLMLLGGVVSCTQPSASSPPQSDQQSYDGPIPNFTGPYATEFTNFYRDAKSKFVRTVLEDGVISDGEYAEMTQKFSTCLSGSGITFNGFDPDGGFKIPAAPNGGDTHAIVNRCSDESGQTAIGALHDLMAINPDNQDASKVMAECLVKNDAVPKGYDAKQFREDAQGRFLEPANLPEPLKSVLENCSKNPLNSPGG